MRIFSFWHFLLFGCFLASVVREAQAQGTQDALTPSIPIGGGVFSPYPLSYVNGGVGWTFTPTEDLLVTAISSSAPQVSFWQGTEQILESFDYTGSGYSLEPIAPFLLSAGQNYSVSAQNPSFASQVLFHIGSQSGAEGIPVVSISGYLTDFGNFVLSNSGQWTPSPLPPGDNTDLFYLGPNFQFQVVPEPSTISLSILGFLFCARKLKPPRR